MNYITVKQLSERWQITPRRIQNMCKDRSLPGAKRFGRSWMIPEDIQRPTDRRSKEPHGSDATSFISDDFCCSVIVAAYRVPDSKDETITSVPAESDASLLMQAQFAYLHGDIEKADLIARVLFQDTDSFEVKIGSAFLLAICAMYRGDVNGWLDARALIEKMPCPNDGFRARIEMWLAALGSSVYDISAFPEWFCRGCFDCLPVGYYPAAAVHYIKYLYIQGYNITRKYPINSMEFKQQLFILPAICEPLISQASADNALVPEICLRLICAATYHASGEDDYAVEHIDRALALALPDRIYAPFAEYRSNLDSLIDERLRDKDINALRGITALHEQLMAGWTLVFNSVMNGRYSNKLTARELEAAKLAALGLTNKEIASRMSISVNSVKGYLQTAKDKAGVRKRSELAEYV